MSKHKAWTAFIVLSTSISIISLIGGIFVGIMWMKNEAVENGHAAWHDYQGMKHKRDDFGNYSDWFEATGNAGFTWNYRCDDFGPPPPIKQYDSLSHKGRDWLTPDEIEEREKIKAAIEWQIDRAKERLGNEKAYLERSRKRHVESIEETERKVKEYEQYLAKLLEQRR